MRILVSVLTITTLSAAVFGQQAFGFATGGSFTSRGSLTTRAGELLQGVPASHHRGVGDLGQACGVNALVCTVQDQNRATRESFSAVFRVGTDARGPGRAFATIGPIRTPGGGTGPGAWKFTLASARPVPIPSCTSFFAFGVRVAIAPSWPRDGLSVHTSVTPRCANARAVMHAWQLIGTTASKPPVLAAWAMELLSQKAAFLQMGNGTAGYGMGGIFPRAGCPLTARTRFEAAVFGGGTSGLFVGTTRIPGAVLVPSTARLYIAGVVLYFGAVPINTRGEAIHTIAASLPVIAPGPTFPFQAIGIRGTRIALTNSQSVTP